MVFVRTNTSTFIDFNCHRSRNHISTSKIFSSRRIPFHKSFTFGVCKVSTLTPRSLSYKNTCTINTCWMKLYEFHILKWKACSQNHGITVTSTCVGRGTRKVYSTITTCCQNSLMTSKSMNFPIIHA